MDYEDRLLLYADILGWSAEIRWGDASRCLRAVEQIHQHAEAYNERARRELEAMEGQVVQTEVGPILLETINRMRLTIQFGAFSDHFVFSLPASFGSDILDIASKLIRDLLRLGFLTRGAVVLGPLYHQDNVIFGRALLDAVGIEEHESFYPRVLVSSAVIEHCSKLGHDPNYKTTLRDQTGRTVINPFAMPFDAPDGMINMASFVRDNFFLPEIKGTINRQIEGLEKEDRHGHAEKWRYLLQFITGPVLEAAPKLRPFWQ